MSSLVGRESELVAVETFLRSERPSAVAIVGEPGIGKTTLWQSAVELARAQGARVLVARPTESEARLAFAGLADLLAEVPDELLTQLPEPQRVGRNRHPRLTAELKCWAAGEARQPGRLCERPKEESRMPTGAGKVRTVGPGSGEEVFLGSIGVRFLIDGADAGQRFAFLEHPMSPRALAAPLHRHSREDECSFVLEGHMGATRRDRDRLATRRSLRVYDHAPLVLAGLLGLRRSTVVQLHAGGGDRSPAADLPRR